MNFVGDGVTAADVSSKTTVTVPGIAGDPIWAAAGDIVIGTGDNTAVVLSKGTAGQVLTMNTGATAPAWNDAINANLLINGGFDFAQRQVPATLTTIATDKYSADRWRTSSQSASLQYVRGDGTAEAGLTSQYFGTFKEITNSGKFMVYQIVEGVNSVTLRGKTITFQAVLKASANKTIKMAVLELQNAGTIDTIPATFVTSWGANSTDPTLGANMAIITASESKSVTSSWATYSVTVTVPDNSKNIICAIWTDSQFAANDTLSIAEAGLYQSSVVQAWHPRHIGHETVLCNRYCIGMFPGGRYDFYISGVSTGATNFRVVSYLGIPMRASPSLVASAANTFFAQLAGANYVPTSIGVNGASTSSCIVIDVTSSAMTLGTAGALTDSTGTSFLILNAEL